MVLQALIWFWHKYRPAEGWLALFLLATAVVSVVQAVLSVDWVPEDTVLSITAVGGLLLGVVLAKRPVSTFFAWLLLLLYGLLIPFVLLASLWPSLAILADGREALAQFWRQNAALFFDRVGGWVTAAVSDGRSQETLVFALGLALLGWFLAAYVAWSTFRQRRPLPGLTVMGVAMAINSYFGQARIELVALFVGLTVLLTAVLHYANLEHSWETQQVDYSGEIRFDLIVYSSGIATGLLVIALVLPAFSLSKLAQTLRQSPTMTQTEETLSRVFAGVRQPQRDSSDELYGAGGAGAMPRDFLLGNAPELSETVVMTATLYAVDSSNGRSQPMLPSHWRALSYEIYSGRGWVLSEERLAFIPAHTPITLPPAQGQTRFTQTVTWLLDERLTRYTAGLPLLFDQDLVVHWRGVEDLVWVQGKGDRYRATSQLTTATPDELRATAVGNIPPAVIARYTQLPDDLPLRIVQLAQEIAGEAPNPYDQARALERFLRQYRYSLTIAAAPKDVDPVDYFLFELQSGYCDYYASAMVVMARSLGLPARLATGYLAQPPAADGVQHIRQIDAHSWAEVYFAGYGWVEFEPTAAFITPHGPVAQAGLRPEQAAMLEETPPLPLPAAQRPFPWGRVLLLLGLMALALWQWRRQQNPWVGSDGVQWAYGRLAMAAQRLGLPTPPSQTPAEFATALVVYLNRLAHQPRLRQLIITLTPDIQRLTELFMLRQYGPQLPPTGDLTAHEAWRRLRRPLWLLRIMIAVSSLPTAQGNSTKID